MKFATKGQTCKWDGSSMWMVEWRKRVAASMCGQITKWSSTTKVAKIDTAVSRKHCYTVENWPRAWDSAPVSVAETGSQEWLFTYHSYHNPRRPHQWPYIIRSWGNNRVQESLLNQKASLKGHWSTKEGFLLGCREGQWISLTETRSCIFLPNTSHSSCPTLEVTVAVLVLIVLTSVMWLTKQDWSNNAQQKKARLNNSRFSDNKIFKAQWSKSRGDQNSLS